MLKIKNNLLTINVLYLHLFALSLYYQIKNNYNMKTINKKMGLVIINLANNYTSTSTSLIVKEANEQDILTELKFQLFNRGVATAHSVKMGLREKGFVTFQIIVSTVLKESYEKLNFLAEYNHKKRCLVYTPVIIKINAAN